MSKGPSQSSVNQLLQSATEEGVLSPQTALIVQDVGAQIQNALGAPLDTMKASEIILVTMMPDDSGSIRFVAGNAQAMRDGHNLVIDAMSASKQKSGILAHTRYLNGHVLFPYSPIEEAIRMDTHNYDPNLGTPLYDQAVVVLGTVALKAQESSQLGLPARSITLLITDGNDEHSIHATPAKVRKLVTEMLMTENHIIAAMGISDGKTDFEQVFKEMGIPQEWILTPKNDAHDIRRLFNLFSQSAVRASQSAASFSQTAAGGFGNP